MNKRALCLMSLAAAAIATVAYAETADETRLKPKWLALDANHDGKVVLSEIDARQAASLKRLDANGDGEITLSEYVMSDLDPGGSARMPLPANVQLISDLSYADTSDPRQQVDIYSPIKPAVPGPLPVVVFLHGGGWSSGSKIMAKGQILPFVDSGKYVAVSIGYRLSWQASWPAQIYDVKAAIRWIRGNAKKYNIDPNRICALGSSAGGHLVAELGVTNGEKSTEGNLGKYLKQSSTVQCVVDMFGPTDLRSFNARPGGADGDITALLGGSPTARPDIAANASPITFVDPTDPPFLIIHGNADGTVNYQESVNLDAALRKAGVPVYFQTIDGGGHGIFGNAVDEMNRRIGAFLDHNFYDPKTVVATDLLKK